MKITITGRKVNLRDNFKELAKKKLSRFDRIFDEDADANVVVTLEKNRQTVEITIKQRGMIYRAESTALEMNDALDQVMSALGRQIRKNKTKLAKKVHSGAIDQYLSDFPVEEPVADEMEAEPEYRVVRTKPVSYTHLDVYKRQSVSIATIFALFVAVAVYGVCMLWMRALKKSDILMLPKGQKIAKILEKHGWIR